MNPVRKIVLCGTGFLGKNIAQTLLTKSSGVSVPLVQVSSRSPQPIHSDIASLPNVDQTGLLPPVVVDITQPSTLVPAFEGADAVVSLVGIMHGTPADFERIQHKGAENVARAAKHIGAKLVHISAIGADESSHIPYARTKALGETVVFEQCPNATIIRPSLVFGPGDGFFARFNKLARILPVLPVFGGGMSRFQPVFVGDLARAVEILCRDDSAVREFADGKIIEAGGPEVFTYRQLMELTLKYSGRTRPIISLPFAAGLAQGYVLEKLPVNLLTVTRAQVEQLKSDNIVNTSPPSHHASFEQLLERFAFVSPTSVHTVLPTYM